MAINVKDILNQINLNGVIASYKIEKRDAEMFWDDERNGLKRGDKVVQYNGFINVQTAENQFATVNVQRNQSFFDGELDYTSQALEAMAKEELDTFYKTKDITKTPTIAIYRGIKLVDNYYVKDQELHESIRVDLGFGQIKVGEPEEEPRMENTLNLAAYVDDVVPEIVNDEETGRAVVKLIVPYTYGSKDKQVIRAMKVNMVAGQCVDEEGEYDLGADLLEYADEVIGYSYLLIGELNGYLEEEEVKPVDTGEKRRGFGRRATVNTSRKRFSEFLLTGLDMIRDGDAFEEEDITEALKMRQSHIAELMKKDEEKQANKTTTKTGRGSFGTKERGTASTNTGASTPAAEGGRPRRTRERTFS